MKKSLKSPAIPRMLLNFMEEYNSSYSAAGDLEEDFIRFCRKKGRLRASLWYWRQVVLSFIPYCCSMIVWSVTMLKNYLKVAVRCISRNPGYSLINIAGLATGIACCLLIMLWVYHEWSFDRFHENGKDICRVYEIDTFSNGQKNVTANSHYPLAAFTKDHVTGLRDAVRFAVRNRRVEAAGSAYEETAAYADAGFLKMFSFPLKKGDAGTALTDPYSAVITEEAALKYYGTEDPIGKELKINGKYSVTVSGVFAGMPRNTHFRFDVLVPFSLINWPSDISKADWGGNPLETFVWLNGLTGSAQAGQQLTEEVLRNLPVPETLKLEFEMQPLGRMHLYGLNSGGLITYLKAMSLIAFFILLLAAVNFINLSTGRASVRAKEVGLRKVTGARKGNLVVQFFGESILLSVISAAVSVLLVALFLPLFNEIAGSSIRLAEILSLPVLAGVAGITAATGALSGLYPAIILSSFMPVTVLKGTFSLQNSRSLLRKILVTGQFALSATLMTSAIFIYLQFNFLLKRDLGFDKNNVAIITSTPYISSNFTALREELLQSPSIKNVSWGSESPSYIGSNVSAIEWDGKNPVEKLSLNFQYVGYDYLSTMKLRLAGGRDFSRKYSTDADAAYIVNEEAVRQMGIADPVGKRLSVFRNEGTIIGVLKDFHFQPLYNEIHPFVLAIGGKSWINRVFVRFRDGEQNKAIEYFQNTVRRNDPYYTVSYHTMQDYIEYNYRKERSLSKIIGCFSCLAVWISLLGLLGLVSFFTQQRKKEIGIRKALGASLSGIYYLIVKEYIVLVIIALGISFPSIWYGVQLLLGNYAYRIDISIWPFAATGGGMLLVTLLVVIAQSFQSANANPAGTLKCE